MFRQTKTLWALIVALGLVAALLMTCRDNKTVGSKLHINDASDKTTVIIKELKTDTLRLLIKGPRCGEPEWPPCFIGSLPANSLNYKFIVSQDSSRVDSGIVIVRFEIDATFRMPASQ